MRFRQFGRLVDCRELLDLVSDAKVKKCLVLEMEKAVM